MRRGLALVIPICLISVKPAYGLQADARRPEPPQQLTRSPENVKEKVTGIGGLFFRARDPEALARWYRDHLGVSPVPTTYEESPWRQEAGPTVFAPFPQKTDYFGRAEQVWMVNFRVRNLDAMVAQLEKAGIEVTVDPERHPNGRFARLHDPEGNPIELWEPKN